MVKKYWIIMCRKIGFL